MKFKKVEVICLTESLCEVVECMENSCGVVTMDIVDVDIDCSNCSNYKLCDDVGEVCYAYNKDLTKGK